MNFELLSELRDIEVMAEGRGIRIKRFLRARYGGRRWRKLKGTATIRLADGRIREAEIHWYEVIRLFPEAW